MISKRITEIRKLKKITEKELSEKIGMSLTGFRQALANDDFKVRTLQKIAQCLNVDISVLLKEIEIESINDTTAECPNCKLKDDIIERKNQIIKEQETLIQQMQNFIEQRNFSPDGKK